MTTPHASLPLTPSAMTRRLRSARLGVIRSYRLAEGALRVYAYGTDEARAIAAHLIRLGYDAVASGDRVTVTLPEPVAEVEAIADAAEPVEETIDELIARVSAEPAVARRLAREEERTRHEDAARARAVDGEFRQTEHGLRYLTADEVAAEGAAYDPDGPAMPAGVGGCDCSADAGPHLAHCDDCSAPVDACVCDDEPVVDDDPREKPRPVEWSEVAAPTVVEAQA